MVGLKDTDKRFRHLEAKVGVMVFVALAGIAAVLVMIGMERDLFTKKFAVHFTAESGAGIVEGMPVKLSGFKVGRVTDLELTGDAKVLVTSKINKKYQRYLKAGSKARLVKEGLIGDAFVEITVEGAEGELIGDGGELPFERAAGIEELIDEAKPVLKEIKEVIKFANSSEGDIKTTLKNIKELTGELRATTRTFSTTLTEARGVLRKSGDFMDDVSQKTTPLIEGSAKAIDDFNRLAKRAGPLMDRMDVITLRAEQASVRLPRTVERFERVLGDAAVVSTMFAEEAPRLRELLVDTAYAMKDVRAIARGVRGSWPVRLTMPPVKEPALVPPDGYFYGERAGGGGG